MIISSILAAPARWIAVVAIAGVVGLSVNSCHARDAHIAERARLQERIRGDSLQLLAMSARLDAARDSLLHRSQVTERVIEHWHETQVPVPVIVRDTLGAPVVDSAGAPEYAVPLPAYTALRSSGDSLAATCNALRHDCASYRLWADSTIRVQTRMLANLATVPPAPHRSWMGRLLEDGLSASAGFAACRLAR